MKKENKYLYSSVRFGISLAILATLGIALPALADSTTPTTTPGQAPSAWGMGRGMKGMMKPAVFGTVSAVSGNTITVASKKGMGANAVATTYTVDATNAKIMKDSAAGTIASIVVGDNIVAQGTITGTNVVATTIRDGKMGVRGAGGKTGTPPTPAFTGNGEPVIAGSISAISGSTLTITNKSNVTYTVDATNAKIVQGQNTITISNVVVGDNVVVQGTVNGNAVVATSVIDQKAPSASTTAKPHPGILGSIGSFFSHIFGF